MSGKRRETCKQCCDLRGKQGRGKQERARSPSLKLLLHWTFRFYPLRPTSFLLVSNNMGLAFRRLFLQAAVVQQSGSGYEIPFHIKPSLPMCLSFLSICVSESSSWEKAPIVPVTRSSPCTRASSSLLSLDRVDSLDFLLLCMT